MTPADIIAEARILLQDEAGSLPTRLSDNSLLTFVNSTLSRMCYFRPDLFSVYEEVATVAEEVRQRIPAGGTRLVEVFRVKGANALTEVVRETLDQMHPQWTQSEAGVPYNFIRHPRNPAEFYLYPRPIAGVYVELEYVKSPPRYTLTQEITAIPETYRPSLVDGVTYLASSIDAEHIASGRAKFFLDSFAESLGVDLNMRNLVDREDAGVNTGRPQNARA